MTVPAGVPSLVIIVPVEGRPKVLAAVLSDAEMARLVDWLEASPRRLELLELATELRDEPLPGEAS